VLVLGAACLALGAIVSVLPRDQTEHTELRDQPVPHTSWQISPVTSLSAGLQFNLSWVSNRPMTIGLATAQAVVSYQVGISQNLTLAVSDSGTHGRFGLTLAEGGNYAVAIRVEPGSGLLNVTIDSHVYQPNAYVVYGVISIGVGVVLIAFGLSTSPRRSHPEAETQSPNS
jgi:hypothetical protein